MLTTGPLHQIPPPRLPDVALINSLRDGMNLVSYEYVACQSDNAGVLVLSEFAGAAQSLGAGAILVNPWNVADVAQVGALGLGRAIEALACVLRKCSCCPDSVESVAPTACARLRVSDSDRHLLHHGMVGVHTTLISSRRRSPGHRGRADDERGGAA